MYVHKKNSKMDKVALQQLKLIQCSQNLTLKQQIKSKQCTKIILNVLVGKSLKIRKIVNYSQRRSIAVQKGRQKGRRTWRRETTPERKLKMG